MSESTHNWIWYGTGMMVFAYGLATMMQFPEWGLEPWSAIHIGLSNLVLTVGMWTAIIQAVFLMGIVLITKKKPEKGTWLSFVFEGIFIDLCLWGKPFPDWFYEVSFLGYVIGILIASLGAAMLLHSHVGAGAKTQFYWLMSKKSKVDIWKIKATVEVVVVGIALGLGAPIGWGTVLVVLISGFLIQSLFNQLERVSYVDITKHLNR